ncbi:MAG TPA: OmpA family protein [Terriglobales bacterium]|nr:OmpA family protein [Terriglobales bacterium]
MNNATRQGAKFFVGVGVVSSMLFAQGCLATRDWVKEQMDPLAGRVSETESRLGKTESDIGSLGTRVSGVEGKLGQFEGRLGQVDAKADKALNAIANLRLERKLVIDMKEGANFGFNSANLPAQAQHEIDSFLSDLKSDGTDGVVFMVAGHTDNAGPEDYNYELGKRRADAVSRYLITKKSVDPLRVVSVSYGESAPAADNSSPQGRAKNRRVEILIYRDSITSAAATAAAPAPQQQSGPRSSQSALPPAERLSQR